jgi:hypothetical protein
VRKKNMTVAQVLSTTPLSHPEIPNFRMWIGKNN